MRLALVINTYPPHLGGLENHVSNLAQGLRELGHEVWVLTLSDSPGLRDDDGVRVLTGRGHLPIAEVISFPSVGTTRRIARFLRENRIDIVGTHTRFFPMSLVGLRAARMAGIPVIHTEHGSGFVATPSPIIFAGSRAVDLTMGRYVLRHADRVLAISAQSAAFIKRLAGVGAEVFHNAIPAPEPHPAPADRPGHLVFVGRVVAGKGWDAFLSSVAALRGRGIDVDGELLGAGAELEDARAMARELGIDDAVSIPGRVPPSQVRQALAGATLVNPTVLSEGFQTTLLEVIAESGRVVTYEVPGAQILADQGAPVVITGERRAESLTDALATMLAAPPVPAPSGLIEQWTWPVRSRQYADILAEVLRDHRA
ncbi:glycosyltransferase family 4 protein [Actinomyces marmotae]|uniref:Glycosyltransferase n=1 Tax=Actinomyces marmotae TaxID=2737173 RepID=A0A6M8B6Z4_9ACTO|nr:glycosyltransferase [Actinomyces marmotae]QKD79181.1 glycosyltransferase [Actinomyces marmotae]